MFLTMPRIALLLAAWWACAGHGRRVQGASERMPGPWQGRRAKNPFGSRGSAVNAATSRTRRIPAWHRSNIGKTPVSGWDKLHGGESQVSQDDEKDGEEESGEGRQDGQNVDGGENAKAEPSSAPSPSQQLPSSIDSEGLSHGAPAQRSAVSQHSAANWSANLVGSLGQLHCTANEQISKVSQSIAREMERLRASMNPPKPNDDQEVAEDLSTEAGPPTNETSEIERPAKVLQPFRRRRPSFDLDDEEVQETLAKLEKWRTTEVIGQSAIAQGVMDIKASPSVVWGQLLDFESFPKKVSCVGTAEVYKREVQAAPHSAEEEEEEEAQEGRDLTPERDTAPERTSVVKDHGPFFGGRGSFPQMPFEVKEQPKAIRSIPIPQAVPATIERIHVRFISPVPLVPGLKLKAHLDVTYEPRKNSYTFCLDDDFQNDFAEVQGHWHVAQHPEIPSQSRVFYEFGLLMPPRLPKYVIEALAKLAIRDATVWVKKESERAAVRAPKPVIPSDAQ